MNGHTDTDGALDAPERCLTILYATQTGNAQDLAESLARHAIRQHFTTQCLSMDEYNAIDLAEESCVVFVVSTTGDGENPDSMKDFWRMLLNRNIPSDYLEEMSFALFGLGDSKFCFPAKKLERRLVQLGAQEIIPKAEGDEQHPQGTDGLFIEWSKKLWEVLDELYPMPSGLMPIPEEQLLPPRHLVVLQSDKAPVTPIEERPPPRSFKAIVTQNKRITAPGHWQDVRHIILECHDPALSYEPGDVAVLWPENPPEEVDAFLDILHWTEIADTPLTITNTVTGKPVLTRSGLPTLRSLATSYLDICSVPRRSFFEMLKHFSSDQQHVEKFQEFCTIEGQEELWDYTTRPRRTIIEVLADFWSSIKISIEYVLDVFPSMKPRQFSIASSLKVHPHEIHLCVAIVKYKTNLKRPRNGVCSRWLVSLSEGVEISVGLAVGGMRIPEPSRPCIFVGPGTGIAPMRAMIEERSLQTDEGDLLVIGNRNRLKDYLFEEDWIRYQRSMNLSILTAFSRDGPRDEKKTYVQDVIAREGQQIYERLINKHGMLFISGSSGKMPQGVKEAIIEIIMKQQGISKEEAQQIQASLEREGRWKQETW